MPKEDGLRRKYTMCFVKNLKARLQNIMYVDGWIDGWTDTTAIVTIAIATLP